VPCSGIIVKRTSFSFSLTHATGPRDASEAASSIEAGSVYLNSQWGHWIIPEGLTAEGSNILDLRLEAHSGMGGWRGASKGGLVVRNFTKSRGQLTRLF
jgi:hypothetical protein